MLSDIELCRLSAGAYTSAATYSAADVHVVRTDAETETVLAFRGTVPDMIDDWLRDLDIWPVWRSGMGWCHRGFVKGAELVFPPVLVLAHTRPVTLVGHSLGGALAIATAGLLVRAKVPAVNVVTFGAPRVGLWKLRRLLRDVPIRQYVDGDDPVPNVPRPYLHMRKVIPVGVPLLNPLSAHALERYAAALVGIKPKV